MGEIADRRLENESRISDIRTRLKAAERIARKKACVYVTGSFGRREASKHSDLDLFIVGKNSAKRGSNGFKKSKLTRLNDIRVKAALIDVTKELQFPEFSGDGKYLVHYSVDELTKTLGTPSDDVTNTFTARLLLLLESHPLIEKSIYEEIIADVVDAYWRDFEKNKASFIPAFLANDILRLWRTFCVNYEARTERAPEDKKAKGRITNYKLKHSRLLTCYSGLLFLLATFKRRGTVAPRDALQMVAKSPTERLEWISSEIPAAVSAVAKLLDLYEAFLVTTNAPEKDLIKRAMAEEKFKKQLTEEAFKFGDSMFELLKIVGADNRFYRLLVV